MLGIVKYLQGGVRLEDLMKMELTEFSTFKHAVAALVKKEEAEIKKMQKKVK